MRTLLLVGMLLTSNSAFAMARHSRNVLPVVTTDPRNQLQVVNSYFTAETVAIRDACIAQVERELLAQLQRQFDARGILIASQDGPAWMGTTGYVVDDREGKEHFQYRLSYRATKDSAEAMLQADFTIHSLVATEDEQIGTPEQRDALGNLIAPARITADRYRRTLTVVASDGLMEEVPGEIGVRNAANDEIVFWLGDAIPGTPEIGGLADARLQQLVCRHEFPIVEVPRR